jgi:signal transduction histidine kinase
MLVDIFDEEARRINHIVGDLLDFARPVAPALHPGAIGQVLDEAIDAALTQVAHDAAPITVERQFDGSLTAVPFDARLLRQAVVNLVLNAMQAMPDGGTLRVRARPEPSEGGDMVSIEVTDTGAGMSEEILARIFEPFFTTRAMGTGLGLAVVRRIVEGHRGDIIVRSRVGEGTSFAIRIPA